MSRFFVESIILDSEFEKFYEWCRHFYEFLRGRQIFKIEIVLLAAFLIGSRFSVFFSTEITVEIAGIQQTQPSGVAEVFDDDDWKWEDADTCLSSKFRTL